MPEEPTASIGARPSRVGRWVSFLIGVLLARVCAGAATSPAPIDFNRDVRPILSENCFACHGPDKDKRKAGLRLDSREEIVRKLESGHAAVVPGKPDESQVLKALALPDDDDGHMPPRKTGKRVTPQQEAALRRWIEEGARWAGHWSYTSPVRPQPPTGPRTTGARNDIDRFVFQELGRHGLGPNPEADRTALIRRLSLDLTGLPPLPEDVDLFVADPRPQAYEKLVDRIMESPHFGERLALAWLDQARYADTSGYHFDGFRQMHLWRDWVIQAFNRNQPFDQFTIEQLAGDLLPNPTVDQKIATGFHRNVMTTDEGGVDPAEYMAKYCVDRVSTTAQVWLGTTLGCAECHDHKFDPLTTREFYQFYAFFHNVPERGLDGTRVRNPGPVLRVPSTDQGARLLLSLDSVATAEKRLTEAEAALPRAQEAWEKSRQASLAEAPRLEGLALRFPLGTNTQSEPAQAASFSSASNAPSGFHEFVPGLGNGALRLRGAESNVIHAANVPDLDATNAFSFGAWIRPEALSGAILSQMEEGPGYRGFDLLLTDGKVEAHWIHKFPESALKVSTKDRVPVASWHHVLATYDGSRKPAGVKIFIDGESRAFDVPYDSLKDTITNAAPLLIGGRIHALQFSGAISDARFYRRALAPAEVSALFSAQAGLMARVPEKQRSDEARAWMKTFFREHEAPDFIAARDRLKTARREKEELLGQIPDTMVMEEMEKPRDTHILVRGNYQNLGEKVTQAIPACWPPLPAGEPTNRLALARWLVSTNNPLTARVTVNRYWAMVFGAGLVKTSNDFGSQGERPSHPELLDWLACEFMDPQTGGRDAFGKPMAHPWDVKHVLRLILTSATYRQSSTVGRQALEKDPYNRLISRGPRFRLEAELIRDVALSASGLLNERIGGPSVKPYQPPGIWDGTDHQYEQSHGPDLYRRGLYVFWKRAAHYPSFQTFDAPSRETCTLFRPRTSTPLQSLVLMNDPVYVEASRALAARALREAGPAASDRVRRAFRLVLARLPQPKELELLESTYRQQRERFTQEPKSAEALLSVGESARAPGLDPVDLAAMTTVANVLLNLNETITK
ncbi:MAG: DUF1553 domain-containing protein [Verrucomicrobia bacterium]|nr:DUF1553 domain-containing protein [Verrucomicrobiota bacterium]MBI3869549.1 DUF1553 domain-containing protein [Verrucomicrobiota bacterium]